MAASPHIGFRAPPPLEGQLQTRAGRHRPPDGDRDHRRRERSLSEVARTDLERYYAPLRAELRRAPGLEPNDARLLLDAFNATLIDTAMIESAAVVLPAEISDAINLEGLDRPDRKMTALPGQAAVAPARVSGGRGCGLVGQAAGVRVTL